MALTRFPTAVASATAATEAVEDQVNLAAATTLTTDGTGGNITLTAAQVINAIYRSTAGTTAAVTYPSAASVVAAIPQVQVGSSFDFIYQNGGSGTGTLTAGTGNTIVGTATVPTTKTQLVKGIVTNATAGSEAVTYVSVLLAAQ